MVKAVVVVNVLVTFLTKLVHHSSLFFLVLGLINMSLCYCMVLDIYIQSFYVCFSIDFVTLCL